MARNKEPRYGDGPEAQTEDSGSSKTASGRRPRVGCAGCDAQTTRVSFPDLQLVQGASGQWYRPWPVSPSFHLPSWGNWSAVLTMLWCRRTRRGRGLGRRRGLSRIRTLRASGRRSRRGLLEENDWEELSFHWFLCTESILMTEFRDDHWKMIDLSKKQ
jgi:hypothetical protein